MALILGSERITIIDVNDTAAECDDWAKHKRDRYYFRIDRPVGFAVGPATIVFDAHSMEAEIMTARCTDGVTKVEVRT